MKNKIKIDFYIIYYFNYKQHYALFNISSFNADNKMVEYNVFH